MNSRFNFTSSLAVATLVFSVGCGGRELPELAPVSGTVKLDGQPLEGVLVSFYPQGEKGGRPGTGVTDAEGHYELLYVEGEKGTKIGPNRVEVTMIWPDGEPTPGVKNKVPRGYGSDSTLTFDVKPDEDNKFDIEMQSSGRR